MIGHTPCGDSAWVDESSPITAGMYARMRERMGNLHERTNPGFMRASLPAWERIYWIAIWNMREQVSAAYRHLDDALGASERPIAVRDVRITLAVDDRAARDRFATARDAIDRRARQGMGRGTAPPPRPARQGLLARAIRALDDWRTR